MFGPYRELIRAPGHAGLVLASLVARLALPMTGIAIISLLATTHHDYALAGAVAAAFVLSYALLSPQTGRCADRFGQRPVLLVAGSISVSGLLLLAASSRWQAPVPCLFAAAVLAGAMPSISALVRARWSALYRGDPRLQAAFSLETVLDEASFIIGPPLALAISLMVFAEGGVVAAAMLLAAGCTALCMIQGREQTLPAVPQRLPRAPSLLADPALRRLLLLMLAMGLIVGSIDITTVAFTTALGTPNAASLVLAAYALGSCASGLLFGAWRSRWSLQQQLCAGALATALGALLLLTVSSVAGLTLAVLVSGVCFAPTMIVAMALVEQQVHAQRVTEAMAWLLAGLNVGVAAGAAGAGRIVDHGGAAAGFLLGAGAAVLVVLAALWAARAAPVAATTPGATPSSTCS